MPGRPLLPLGGHRSTPYPCGREEEGLTSQAARIIPEDPHVSQAYAWELSLGLCWGSLQGHPQGVFKATRRGAGRHLRALGLYSGVDSGSLECPLGGLERYAWWDLGGP